MLSAETLGMGKDYGKGKTIMVGASRPQFSTTKRYPGCPGMDRPPYSPAAVPGVGALTCGNYTTLAIRRTVP